MAHLMIYGATGYTGRLVTTQAQDLGLDIVIAGRNLVSLSHLSEGSHLPYRNFGVEGNFNIDSSLHGITTLLNCAGPFAQTTPGLVDACIRVGVHYLDTSAELSSYLMMEGKDAAAKNAGVMLLPGCGGSVAMLGCLASRASASHNDTHSIDVALHVSGPLSRGTMKSAQQAVISETMQRKNGELVTQDPSATADFDFGDGRGLVTCFAATLPDLLTIGKATDAANVRTYVSVDADAFQAESNDGTLAGPTLEERKAHPYHAAVTVHGADGAVSRGHLTTLNGYTFTALAAAEALRRVAGGEYKSGFQTPVTAFGDGFAESIVGTEVSLG